MSKVYTLHEYSGEYEDSHDYILGVYSSKESADSKKLELEEKLKREYDKIKNCVKCYNSDFSGRFRCDKFNLDEDDECDNLILCVDDYTYEVKEYELLD